MDLGERVSSNDDINIAQLRKSRPIADEPIFLEWLHEDLAFDGRAEYNDPEVVWTGTEPPTDIQFFRSDKLGAIY